MPRNSHQIRHHLKSNESSSDLTLSLVLDVFWIVLKRIFIPQCDVVQSCVKEPRPSSCDIPTNWEKVLYKKQPIPDNYVAADFLSNLQKNMHVRKYNLATLVVDAGCVYQQLCCIGVFWAFYFYLLLDWITSTTACIILGLVLLIGYALLWLARFQSADRLVTAECCTGNGLSREIFRHLASPTLALELSARELGTCIVIAVFTLLLAPILHSLLASVSTDSIYAMTISFLFINWACLDYSTHSNEFSYEPGSPNSTAFSASLLAALCLTSRLASPWHTFALLVCATELFVLWPTLAHSVRARAGRRGELSLTVISAFILHALVLPLAWYEAAFEYKCLMAVSSLTALLCLNLLGPMLLIRMQRIKRTIHGPWDEAVVHPD